jgi:hypothetical protein
MTCDRAADQNVDARCASSDRVEAELLARKLACHRLHHPDPTGLLPGMQDDAAITIERLSMPVLRTQPSRGTSPGEHGTYPSFLQRSLRF